MADFLTNLWDSVFTPGTTPTLLLATNATFACLQLLLAGLLAATLSIHFVILSLLCGGLWWSINWFANEVRQAQEKEEQAKHLRARNNRDRKTSPDDSADDEGGDLTETEVDLGNRVTKTLPETEAQFVPSPEDERLRETVLDDLRKQGHGQGHAAGDHDGEPVAQTTGLQTLPDDESRRRKSTVESIADTNTDSEWEKVEQER